MEEKKGLEYVKELAKEPCLKVLLADDANIQKSRKFRKKMEELSNELSWFNGLKKPGHRPEERAFLEHVQTHYLKDAKLVLPPRYRSITEYTFGEEPVILYFYILFAKRAQEFQAFQAEHTPAAVKGDKKLQQEFLQLNNEYRLLAGLLQRLEALTAGVVRSINECFVTKLDEGIEELDRPTVQYRYMRSLRSASDEVSERLLNRLKELEAANLPYLEALFLFRQKKYEETLKQTQQIPEDSSEYQRASTLSLECYANLGDSAHFIELFQTMDSSRINTLYFVYLLQILVCSMDYAVLDTDEFDESIKELLQRPFDQTQNTSYAGMIIRNFVRILLDAEQRAEKLTAIKQEKGEDAIPEDELNRLYQLQMALELYPSDLSQYVEIEKMEELGAAACREKIGKLILPMLIEKNPDKSFDNIFAAFDGLYRLGLSDAYIRNVEANAKVLATFAKTGIRPAVGLLLRAKKLAEEKQVSCAAVQEALEQLGVKVQAEE